MIIASEGEPYVRGLVHGKTVSGLIRKNVELFYGHLSCLGIARDRLHPLLQEIKVDEELNEYVKGIADGAAMQYLDILALNLVEPIISPEECTVMIAMKDSTANGSTIVLKNSDKIGSERFVGDKFYKNKEVNVIVFEKPDSGNKFIAVSAAGTASVKMGMNEKGVMAGTNISRTLELRQRKVDVTQIRALDRAWLAREGIVKGNSAKEATQIITKMLIDRPMSTPGNLEFVDKDEGYIIEGSYDRMAMESFKEGVHARSNRFQILESLNDPADISSYARYIRCMELLNENKGRITVEKMIEFSQDHKHGPGLNSICRHSQDFRDETSLSSAVMEVRGDGECIFNVALGKPCRAWKDDGGHISINLKADPSEVPKEFYNGDAFKKFYIEAI